MTHLNAIAAASTAHLWWRGWWHEGDQAGPATPGMRPLTQMGQGPRPDSRRWSCLGVERRATSGPMRVRRTAKWRPSLAPIPRGDFDRILVAEGDRLRGSSLPRRPVGDRFSAGRRAIVPGSSRRGARVVKGGRL